MFKLKQNNTTVRTELVAGITTFMAMAYILMVNAGMFSTLGGDALGASYYNAVYIATALSAVFGTLLIGLLSNLPLAQASGMGLNAFFVYSVCIGMGFTYANALVMVLVDGIVFLLLTVTGLRRLIFDAIPKAVKAAIAPGIGLFIAFLGLQNSGIVVNSDSTLVDLHSFNIIFGHTTWAEIMPLLITIAALIAIGAMSKKKIKGAVFWGIIGGAVLYYALGLLTIDGFYASNVQSKLSLSTSSSPSVISSTFLSAKFSPKASTSPNTSLPTASAALRQRSSLPCSHSAWLTCSTLSELYTVHVPPAICSIRTAMFPT